LFSQRYDGGADVKGAGCHCVRIRALRLERAQRADDTGRPDSVEPGIVTKQAGKLMPQDEKAYPFLSPAFFGALEDTGAVSRESGWQPDHWQADGFWMPLYRKFHSRGEYVFDFAWADAYQRHGLEYYPKLVTAIPFTPVPGPRWRGELPDDFLPVLDERLRLAGASGWHLLFPDQAARETLPQEGLVTRHACHFRWFNRGYGDFDDFLGALVSRKRKSLRRERRRVSEQGIQVHRRTGESISADWWAHFYRFYAATYLKRGQRPYLSPEFFRQAAERLSAQTMMVMAFHDGEPAAAALYFFDRERLYGRYWGCLREFDALHFELCYYQGISFAIEQGLTEFDPGVQGEHKILRGFEPVITYSLHRLLDPRFQDAIARFCADEARMVADYRAEAATLLPFRKEP
jgi:predicted N-acyltransferase